MTVRWVTGFLDTPPEQAPAAERFWLAVTGTTLSARRGDDTFATLQPPDGDATLRVQVVGDGPPRGHLDLHVTDPFAAAPPILALGAQEVFRDDEIVVLRSPAGIAFCLVPWRAEQSAPAAPVWPGGQSSIVDQLCLDIPADGYDAEVAFWRAVTGWEHQPMDDCDEFQRLLPPPPIPMRLLLQRLESGPPGVHLDLACDGVPAEVARHEALGATVVRRVPGDWTTLLDPAGRPYCLTLRPPSSSR